MSRGFYGGGGGGGGDGVSPEQLEAGLAGRVPLSAYTEHGVILAASDVGVPGALEPGPNGASLVADSAEPLGLRWEAVSAAGSILAWTGSDYAPSALKADTSKPRLFVGPVDPAGVSGVVLNPEDWYDTWLGGE